MGRIYGPQIVTDGLVLYLDAANNKSYPGSGTTWYDLSGNENHGTLVNGPTYSSENCGSLVFDGVNDYITIPNPLNQSTLVQEWTVSSFININDSVSQRLVQGLAAGLYVCYTQGNNSLLYLNSGDNDYYIYGRDLGNIGWVFVTFRFKNTTGERTIYRNLTNISTFGPNKTSTPVSQSSTFNLCNVINGKMALMLMYNGIITDLELAQNYNALKSRFNL